ncbi:Swi3-domain-containing protein [Cucurbitaria berberidis CBS 394.84]|uniref:Chromosome segregation in meiosis protein n=1 Tax=Cucurbitaria berberidis CBS 394.84 TaxID=1168544 RepID=A0A9P4GB56_9PLEO|nr:Swi3-domain-containing protein [Cucurbitaria berberidis CBS 394.84]KAF1842020.1 Swi3-domain-containing protein [Cucurbitaria berberidis CBS 394.84]
MASMSPQSRDIPPDDELDDILNGIAEGRDIPTTNDNQTKTDRPSNRKSDITGALGIDEEIVITKKRIPIPKLDDQRLLSDPGIPRLRKISKERLRFKGKGHEYGDITRMLNMYQLWLDDLYPRAKFADALAIIEKVGHTKRMQMMRKDWIDEGKPRRTTEQDDEELDRVVHDDAQAEQHTEAMEGVEKNAGTGQPELEPARKEQTPRPSSDAAEGAIGDDPDEDELDALLAESAPTSKTLPSRPADDPFADEMEAMADLDMW